MSRNIALSRTSIGAMLTFVVGQLVTFGVFPQATGDKVVSVGTVIVGAAFTLAAAVHVLVGLLIHRKVTPVSDPKNDSGQMLVPAPEPAEHTFIQAPSAGSGDLPDPLGLASKP